MSRDYDRDSDNLDDDARARDRRSRRQKSSSGPLLLILGGIGCVILLGCGGLIALAIWGFSTLATQLPQATDAANEFLSQLQQNQVDGAYALTSTDFQRRNTLEQFADFVKKFEMFGKHTSRELNGANFFQNASGKQVIIKMTLQAPNNAMTCTLEFVEEQGVWKVNNFTVP